MSTFGMLWLLMGLLAVFLVDGVHPLKLLSAIGQAKGLQSGTATASSHTRSVTTTTRSVTVYKKNCWTDMYAAEGKSSSSSSSSAAAAAAAGLNVLEMCHENGYNVDGLYVVPEFTGLLHSLNREQRNMASMVSYPRDYSLSIRSGDEFDVIVVGCGAAGSVLASKVSDEKGLRVLMLEAGGAPRMESEVPGLWANAIGTEMDWNYFADADATYGQGLDGGRARVIRGCALGGTTALNTMLYDRGVRADYDRLESAGLSAWGWQRALRYYKRSEDCRFEKITTSTAVGRSHGRGGKLRVDSFRTARTVHIRQAFSRALSAVDYGTLDFVHVDGHRGFVSSVATVRDGLRVNAAKAFLRNADRKYNLKISARSLAKRIVFDNRKAVGVEFVNSVGEHITVKCKGNVVLSAGPVGSPKLLLESGVGPKALLDSLRIPVVVDSNNVGSNLQAHPNFLGMVVKFDSQPLRAYSVSEMVFEYLTKHTGPLANIGLGSFTGFIDIDGNGVPDVQIFFYYYSEDDTVFMPPQLDAFNFNDQITEQIIDLNDDNDIQMVGISLLRPKNTGTVTIRKTGDGYEPTIKYGSLAEEDVSTLLKAIDWVKNLVTSVAFKHYGPTVVPLKIDGGPEPDADSEAYWRHAIKHLTTMNVQMAGTCSMATEISKGVVSQDLDVFGTEGLKVVDSSALPIIFSAESSAPSMMVAEKAADIIKKKLGCQVDESDEESS